ncbi:MAG: M48 family metallopeptidase, partial [Lachnospiraceae bacterium]|nr:M48 family metallopeptidase [Lachnospiraceae bacterium]
AQKKMAERRADAGNRPSQPAFTKAEIEALKRQAKKVITPIVAQVAAEIGVTYGAVSVRAQKTRWGSCSSKGNLNFNCLLILLPEHIQRYVIVHELCHRKEMNHSQAFWREVGKYQPTYQKDRAELREAGRVLLERME